MTATKREREEREMDGRETWFGVVEMQENLWAKGKHEKKF